MQNNLGPANLGPTLDDPLIRWRRRLSQTGTDARRALWIYKKLSSFYRQQITALALVGLLISMLHPVSVVEAADAAGPASVDQGTGLADFSFVAIEEVPTEQIIQETGFIVKPVVLATDIGRPERELIAEQAKKAAAQKKRRAQLATTTVRSKSATITVAVSTIERSASVTGNNYPYGYCTWWAKSKRPDLPNHLGNAHAWLSSAARAGYQTGTTPKVGAIFVSSEGRIGHVGYVEEVTDDSIIVSDMNVIGFGKLSRRTMKITSGVIRGYIY